MGIDDIKVRGGESLEMAQVRVATSKGHKLRSENGGFCITSYACIKCGKCGFDNLQEKCVG